MDVGGGGSSLERDVKGEPNRDAEPFLKRDDLGRERGVTKLEGGPVPVGVGDRDWRIQRKCW